MNRLPTVLSHRRWILLTWTALLVLMCSVEKKQTEKDDDMLDSKIELAEKIQSNPEISFVLKKAQDILGGDLNAGSHYGEVWIRDLNTFIEMALGIQDKSRIRQSLITFFGLCAFRWRRHRCVEDTRCLYQQHGHPTRQADHDMGLGR